MNIKFTGKGIADAPSPEPPDAPAPPSIPTPIPPLPLPTVELRTIWDLVKIVTFVLLWYITSDANHALTAAVDYSKIATAGTTLSGISWAGAKIGMLQGAILSVQALAIIWASPTLFIYLGPVLSAAFRTPIGLIADYRCAVSSEASDRSDRNGKVR